MAREEDLVDMKPLFLLRIPSRASDGQLLELYICDPFNIEVRVLETLSLFRVDISCLNILEGLATDGTMHRPGVTSPQMLFNSCQVSIE